MERGRVIMYSGLAATAALAGVTARMVFQYKLNDEPLGWLLVLGSVIVGLVGYYVVLYWTESRGRGR